MLIHLIERRLLSENYPRCYFTRFCCVSVILKRDISALYFGKFLCGQFISSWEQGKLFVNHQRMISLWIFASYCSSRNSCFVIYDISIKVNDQLVHDALLLIKRKRRCLFTQVCRFRRVSTIYQFHIRSMGTHQTSFSRLQDANEISWLYALIKAKSSHRLH